MDGKNDGNYWDIVCFDFYHSFLWCVLLLLSYCLLWDDELNQFFFFFCTMGDENNVTSNSESYIVRWVYNAIYHVRGTRMYFIYTQRFTMYNVHVQRKMWIQKKKTIKRLGSFSLLFFFWLSKKWIVNFSSKNQRHTK